MRIFKFSAAVIMLLLFSFVIWFWVDRYQSRNTLVHRDATIVVKMNILSYLKHNILNVDWSVKQENTEPKTDYLIDAIKIHQDVFAYHLGDQLMNNWYIVLEIDKIEKLYDMLNSYEFEKVQDIWRNPEKNIIMSISPEQKYVMMGYGVAEPFNPNWSELITVKDWSFVSKLNDAAISIASESFCLSVHANKGHTTINTSIPKRYILQSTNDTTVMFSQDGYLTAVLPIDWSRILADNSNVSQRNNWKFVNQPTIFHWAKDPVKIVKDYITITTDEDFNEVTTTVTDTLDYPNITVSTPIQFYNILDTNIVVGHKYLDTVLPLWHLKPILFNQQLYYTTDTITKVKFNITPYSINHVWLDFDVTALRNVVFYERFSIFIDPLKNIKIIRSPDVSANHVSLETTVQFSDKTMNLWDYINGVILANKY